MGGINKWFEVNNAEKVISPALLVYPNRVEDNIKRMIALAGDAEKLRPHIKTHKIAELVNLQLKQGITKFKCATIAEAELLAKCGAKDILLAMQPVGPNVERFLSLVKRYPDLMFSALVDNTASVHTLSALASAKGTQVSVWLDIDNGMGRTGIQPDEEAAKLYAVLVDNPHLEVRGLHVYDGHIHETDPEQRERKCNEDFEAVAVLKDNLEKFGFPVETIVAGGTPTMRIHAKRKNVEVSPGTPLLWDRGYADQFPDLPFLPAGVLLTRVVSKPGTNWVCFDLGHKSLAAEMELPRVAFLERKGIKQISQHEEHLVVKTEEADKFEIGEVYYALPMHICPTVTKYKSVLIVEDKKVNGSWKVAARDHE